jgi:hypothetical protein
MDKDIRVRLTFHFHLGGSFIGGRGNATANSPSSDQKKGSV